MRKGINYFYNVLQTPTGPYGQQIHPHPHTQQQQPLQMPMPQQQHPNQGPGHMGHPSMNEMNSFPPHQSNRSSSKGKSKGVPSPGSADSNSQGSYPQSGTPVQFEGSLSGHRQPRGPSGMPSSAPSPHHNQPFPPPHSRSGPNMYQENQQQQQQQQQGYSSVPPPPSSFPPQPYPHSMDK